MVAACGTLDGEWRGERISTRSFIGVRSSSAVASPDHHVGGLQDGDGGGAGEEAQAVV